MNNNSSPSSATSHFSERSRPGRKRTPIDPAILERLARELPSQLAVATELDISQSTLAHRLLDTPELRRAWERGRAAFEEAKAERASARTLGSAKTLAPAKAAEPPKPPRPAPAFVEGTARGRVLAALAGGGGLTFGGLMHATGLDHYKTVAAVQQLMTERRIVATNVGGERRHFLAKEATL